MGGGGKAGGIFPWSIELKDMTVSSHDVTCRAVLGSPEPGGGEQRCLILTSVTFRIKLARPFSDGGG